jgi:hypothetical protein
VQVGFGQRLVYPGLIRAERAATLEQQRNLLERRAFACFAHIMISGLSR